MIIICPYCKEHILDDNWLEHIIADHGFKSEEEFETRMKNIGIDMEDISIDKSVSSCYNKNKGEK